MGLLAVVVVIFAGIGLGSCAVKLAPEFDQAIFDGLSKANEEAMKLFASAGSGPFSKRAKAYDDVIGELNAVQVQVSARGAPPPPSVLVEIAGVLGDKKAGQKLAAIAKPPTSADIDNLIRIMNAAKADDKLGLLARNLDFYKPAFSLQMAQALAYEKILQR